jgi:putative tRNA adenosine deaminase-associated protein
MSNKGVIGNMNFHGHYLTGLSFLSNEWKYLNMADFDDDLVEDIEEFDVSDDDSQKVISLTNELDIAVAAWHEDGRWTLGILPDPNDIAQIITRLKAQQTNGGSIALISIDEEFFILIRVLGTHISLFLSDATAALDYEVAEELLEIADIPVPEDEDDEAGPIGQIEILADLGMSGMEITALCEDEELFPDEQLEAIANRLGFGDQFAELLEL